jgi:conjugal transfer ATP-binding protein TraC
MNSNGSVSTNPRVNPAPARGVPTTGKGVGVAYNQTNPGNNYNNQNKTNFGPAEGTFKPVNQNFDLGKELQQNAKTSGSYGNYGQKANPFNEPNPFAQPPNPLDNNPLKNQNLPAAGQNISSNQNQQFNTNPSGNTGYFNNNQGNQKLVSQGAVNSRNNLRSGGSSLSDNYQNNFGNSNQNSSNFSANFSPNSNQSQFNNSQEIPGFNGAFQPSQNRFNNPNNNQNNPVNSFPNGNFGNANSNQNQSNFSPNFAQNRSQIQSQPQTQPQQNQPQRGNFQNTPQNGPQNNQGRSNGFFGFGKKENQPVIQPVLDRESVAYLKSLNPSELRKEVIKTEIEIQKALIDNERAYREGISTIRDLIAPSGVKINSGYMELNTKMTRSFFILIYPRIINMGWLEGLVNADLQMDISIFIYPRDSGDVLRDLKGKVAKIQASLQINAEQGKARDPALETAYRDVEGLRDAIQQGVEKFFRTGVYITVYGDSLDELEKNSQAVEGILSQQSIILKRAALQMDDGFNASLPILKDDLDVISNLNTGPLSACFPFVSSDLSSDTGILYGINRHNSSLIIFDRFELENANSLVFATSGAGKSYAVKLEILRSLMLGVAVIVVDPEQEYKVLADTLGGTYINMSLNSNNRINPFDLPKPLPGESTADIIRTAIIDLMGLMSLMLGKLNPTEVGIMERAIKECYSKRDITDNSDISRITPPTMTDLVEILQGIIGGDSLAQRLYRYTEGTFSGLFNKPTNINVKNDFIVFNIRDLQETLRPIAMYILLKFVWTEIRTSLKKRILAIDEAWIMMQYEDSARFLFSLAKRARKYYLGITTITQDVGDFLNSPLGKPIITNAAMKILLKQSTAAIDGVGETFALTGGEKQVLLQSGLGQGIFFAGPRHVAIEIIAFPTEHRLITTNPKDLLKIQEQDASKG